MEGVCGPGYVTTWAAHSRQPAGVAGWTEATGQAERRGWGRDLVAHFSVISLACGGRAGSRAPAVSSGLSSATSWLCCPYTVASTAPG